MSDPIKHECGVAVIRLLKPLEYYHTKYGSWMYGLNKLYLLMEKQHNRGQDGAGIANLKIEANPGQAYIYRERSNKREPIRQVFEQAHSHFIDIQREFPERFRDPKYARDHLPFSGELFLGHLRYGTYGRNELESVHPVMRMNNWRSRNLVLAGNFNLTNVDEIFESLVNFGEHPVAYSDTVTVLEKIGHYLDQDFFRNFEAFKEKGYDSKEVSRLVSERMDLAKILKDASRNWDGGYAIAGLIGHGDAFVMRDPSGIRPAFYYSDDEVAVVASERPVIQTVFNANFKDIHEIDPGHALIIRKNGNIDHTEINPSAERKSCSFERIYFSRGSDKVIYEERKELGRLLIPAILKKIEYDLENAVFSYIPNTAETAFFGMIKGMEEYLHNKKVDQLLKLKDPSAPIVSKILNQKPRVEKIAIKDVKLRTFITQDEDRDDLVAHVYDITYGTIRKNLDTLIIIDDSIVRGTTLKKSILRILDRLSPKKIIVVSSSPQIRYPDCYGIDMAILGDFIAFQAAIELLHETGRESVINEVYNKSKAQADFPKEEIINHVKSIYEPFTADEISQKIADLLKPKDIRAEVEIVYQSIEGLHQACPNDLGDWYFTGNYPTPGGNRVVNSAFINYVEKNNKRAY